MKGQLPSLADVEQAFSEPLPDFSPVVLTPLEVPIEGVTAKYFVDNKRVKIQLFHKGGPFPLGFQSGILKLAELVKTLPPKPIVEYVPEAKSWYFEFTPSPIMGLDNLLPWFTNRMARLVESHAKGTTK